MTDLAGWFAQGGVWMYVVLLLALIGVPADLLVFVFAVISRFVGGLALTLARVASVGALLLSPLPGLVGLVGWWAGSRSVAQALSYASPEVRDELAAVGYAEARVPLVFGGGVSALLVVLALVACVVALAPRPVSVDDDDPT